MIRGRKTIALVIATLMIASSNLSLASAIEISNVSSRETLKQTNLSGGDRYKTAVEISKAGWSKSDKALLVNANALPDALCASPLADEYNAPILLTEKNTLNNDTLMQLKSLEVKEVTIIGSVNVVSQAQEDQLVKEGFKVERIGGIDRYDTSLKIANKLKGLYQAKGNTGRKTVFLANGVKGLADATSVSSPAGIKDAVILYTNGQNLNGIKDYITTSCDDVYLIGGPSVISEVVENELKTTTNKGINRLAGGDRKDTNAKVIKEFFPNQAINKIYVAKDGSGDDSQLVDGLAVGSLASKNNSPVLLASDNLGVTQKELLSSKKVSEIVQVGGGRNAEPYKQAIDIIYAIAQPEPEDGMKLPTLTFAKEGKMLMTGTGGYETTPSNKIEGNLYVKWGNSKTKPHSYGAKNQAEYDYTVNYVKEKMNGVNFRLQPEWVYLQHFINNGYKDLDANYIDPILLKNGIDMRYTDWKSINEYTIIGLQKGLMTREDAENLSVYKSTLNHILSQMPKNDQHITDGTPYSAMDFINGRIDCDSRAQFNLLVSDILGYNGYIAGSTGHQDNYIIVGSFHWNAGRIPTLNTGDNVFTSYECVLEAPTY